MLTILKDIYDGIQTLPVDQISLPPDDEELKDSLEEEDITAETLKEEEFDIFMSKMLVLAQVNARLFFKFLES